MLKVKTGDLDKLGLLFERYNKKLFHYFYRLTWRRDISQDLVQGVFERILKYRHTYENDGSFATWLFQVARNHHIDHYRRNRKLVDDENFDPEKLADDRQQEHDFESEGDRELRLLKQALEQLDETKRETLVLSRFQGFKYKEIAEIMDCTESAVKVRVFRALNELKEIITELRNKEENYD